MSDPRPTGPPAAMPPLPPAIEEVIDAARTALSEEILAGIGGPEALGSTVGHIITSAACSEGVADVAAACQPLADALSLAATTGICVGWALRDSEVVQQNLHKFRQQAQER